MTEAHGAPTGRVAEASVAIVGGGLAGSFLALALAQRGHTVEVYERRADPRQHAAGEGRSINLGLSARGMQALREVGLLDEVLQRSVTMHGRVIHAADGSTRYQPYGKDAAEVLHSIDRNELNHLLLDRAERTGAVRLHFGHRLLQLQRARRELVLSTPAGVLHVQARWVIGADGAFSRMRSEMQQGMRADYHQEYLEWGYKELTLPAAAEGRACIELQALHVWPRGHCLCVSHPNRDGSHTITLFLPFEGPASFATTQTNAQVEALFAAHFPDLLPLLPDVAQQWTQHATGELITTRTRPWSVDSWAVLVGDACHAVYPFYGQGMNSAFEDCVCLLHSLAAQRGDLAAAFRVYEQSRRPHTDVLAELSKANFIELRSKVRSLWFVTRRRLDVVLNRLWPRLWRPLYSMVAHSTIPYRDALMRARRQERILGGSLLVFSIVVSAGLAYLLLRQR